MYKEAVSSVRATRHENRRFNSAIYIIKIGRFVCGQLCDWSARSAGLACVAWAQRRPICAGRARAQRGPVKPKTSVASFRLVYFQFLNHISTYYNRLISHLNIENFACDCQPTWETFDTRCTRQRWRRSLANYDLILSDIQLRRDVTPA